MANHFCTNSVEEQVNYLIDKVKGLNTNKLDKTAVVQETGTGTDVVMSQKAVTDAIANKGLDTLTDVNLTLGNTTVQYDTTEGIQINSTARFVDGSGNHDAMMDIAIPIVGTDNITIDKAADSENIEVSGKNLIKDPYPGVNNTGANIVNYKPYGSADWGSAFVRNTHSLVNNAEAGAIVGYDNNGVIYAKTTSDDDYSVVNKKYADDNYRKVITGQENEIKVYVTKYGNTDSWMFLNVDPDGTPGAEIPQYGTGGTLRANMPTTPLDNSVVNKKYAYDHFLEVYDSGIIDPGEVKIPGMSQLDETANRQKWFPTCVGEYVANSAIALTDAEGHLGTNTPIADKHCANKKFVEDAIVNIPLKTLFGSQNIHGTGNIDLYRHNIHISSGISGFGAEIYFTYYSSNNLQVDSLTDLKTLMGNEFEEGVSGLTSTQIPVIKITQTGFTAGTTEYTWASMTSTTITDTVTTI